MKLVLSIIFASVLTLFASACSAQAFDADCLKASEIDGVQRNCSLKLPPMPGTKAQNVSEISIGEHLVFATPDGSIACFAYATSNGSTVECSTGKGLTTRCQSGEPCGPGDKNYYAALINSPNVVAGSGNIRVGRHYICKLRPTAVYCFSTRDNLDNFFIY